MSQNLDAKTIGAIIGAAALGAVGLGAAGTSTKTSAPPAATVTTIKTEPRVVYEPRAADARSLGALSARELIEVGERLRKLSPGKIQVFCAGNYCRGLAEDLDEVFESSGHDSYLEVPLVDPGKGIGISPDNGRSREIAAALRDGTKGRVDLQILPAKDAKGNDIPIDGTVIVLARRKPST